MRAGFIGNQLTITTPTGTPGTILATAEMAATDRLLEVAASLYGYDNGQGFPVKIATMRNVSPAGSGFNVLSAGIVLSNGNTLDPMVNNREGTLLASAARTVTTLSATQTNYNSRGVQVNLEISVASGTGGLTVRFCGISPITGNPYYLNSDPTAIIATGAYAYELYPGGSTAGAAGTPRINVRYAGSLPRSWAIQVVVGDASSYTYSLSYALVN